MSETLLSLMNSLFGTALCQLKSLSLHEGVGTGVNYCGVLGFFPVGKLPAQNRNVETEFTAVAAEL